ncbi:PIG-L deacetylase family protein [Streptomyces sp. SLBN-31]|uniref:PIG-L deacetylase family protein n=1 Tax=Streptomyces sp. SLBN-31 TaxID=2768444 RepID=UPI001150373E|nr:PIG-L family deacetylase [Streptomyces sp. SLBN-31]TQJ91465.1 GlcNAc-PI de-N-acetylase [Streptomyces sp. SLBN-31]
MTADPFSTAVEKGVPLVVLSPHLDDAVLSCGALMAHTRQHAPVTVVTLFTTGAPPPYTLSARRFLHLSGMRDAEELYAARRAEDRDVLTAMGITWRHMGLTEGLFRRKALRGRGAARGLSRLLPEREHVYPTYRRHLAAGRISPYDGDLLRTLTRTVRSLAAPEPSVGARPLLLAPLAIGGHVDHLLVRTAAETSRRHVVYYGDFPYIRHEAMDTDFVRRNGLREEVTWTTGLGAKSAAILGYRTQSRAMFPGGHVPLGPELYLFSETSS